MISMMAASALMATPVLTGDLIYATPPANNVQRHQWESSSNFFIFKELSAFTVDAATSAMTGIAEGTTVNVYFVHFDPVGSTSPSSPLYLSGTATFDYEILYAMRTTTQLQSFDSIAIAAGSGLTYQPFSSSSSSGHAWRGHTGTGDLFSGVGTNMASITMEQVSGADFDQIRLFVATPEPASMLLMGFGLLGLGFVGVRRRRSN
ncbi:MAG: PEP-CTERM sorting domain-containing protein [Bryobacteraceae bacterium]